jgi:hypothetical protein
MGIRPADSERRLQRGRWGRSVSWAEYGLGLLLIATGATAAVLLVAGVVVLTLVAMRS